MTASAPVGPGPASPGPPGPGLDAGTRQELAASLRQLFASCSGPAAIGRALDDLGWLDVLAADPAAATCLLFAEHGRALASSRVLDSVLLAELAPALPAPGGPRAVLYPLPGFGVLLGSLDGIAEVILPVPEPRPAGPAGPAGLAVLPAARLAGPAAEAGGFDPGSGWLTVEAGVTAGAQVIPAPEAWMRAEAAGRRALAAEIAGVCEAALALATAYTVPRR